MAKAPAKKKAAAKAPTAAQRARGKAQAQRARERERERVRKEREKAKLQKEREREKLRQDREKAKLQKERQRQKAQLEKERQKARLEKERQKARLEKERQKAKLQQEREAAAAIKEAERAQKAAERAAAAEAREAERKRKAEEREAAKAAREEERIRKAAEREAEKVRREEERARKAAEREAEKKRREEERAERAAKREAYKKAKEAEQAKIRAEKEAARRALESKIARATKRAQRSGSRPAMAARAYRPDAIPDQSGTSRHEIAPPASTSKFANLRTPAQLQQLQEEVKHIPPQRTPSAPPPPPPPERFEERFAKLDARLQATSESFQQDYREAFDMSWIYHDSHLEGVVYSYQELRTAIDPNITVVPDSSLQPVCEEIRRHKAAIDLARELATKKRVPITVDMVKRFYVTLHPEEGDIKSVAYRKDIPQHRLYFHEYAAPDRLAYRVRQTIEWLNGPEPKKIRNPIRIAARVHYDLVRTYPFPIDSGKVARLIMNVILMRAGYPPAILHSTERQRYYESLKGSLPTLVNMIQEAIVNGLESVEKLVTERESRKRAFIT